MNTDQIPPGAVVVGVDGSIGSNRAAAWGFDQARLEHRPLALVHCAAVVVPDSAQSDDVETPS